MLGRAPGLPSSGWVYGGGVRQAAALGWSWRGGGRGLGVAALGLVVDEGFTGPGAVSVVLWPLVWQCCLCGVLGGAQTGLLCLYCALVPNCLLFFPSPVPFFYVCLVLGLPSG